MGAHNELANLYRGRGAIGQSPPPFGQYRVNARHPLVAGGELVALWASCAGAVDLVSGNAATIDGAPAFNGSEWGFEKANSERLTIPINPSGATWLNERGLTLLCISGRPSKNDANECVCDVHNSGDSNQHVALGQSANGPFGRLFMASGRLYVGGANQCVDDQAYTDYADRDRLIICACHNSATVDLYENGRLLKSQATNSVAQTFSVDALRVGYSASPLRSGYWDSSVEMVAFFSRALGQAEIRALTDNPYQLIVPSWLAAMDFYRRAAGGVTIKAVADTGSGADAPAGVAVSLGVGDSGAGADLPAGASAALLAGDAGAGADIAALFAALAVADAGNGADLVSVLQAILKSVAESGAGADAVANVQAQLAVADLGAGSESISQMSVSITVPDSGAGADSPAVAASFSVSDSGGGVDLAGVLQAILISVADSASGADAPATVAVSAAVADGGSGVDSIAALAALIALADSASAVDAAVSFEPGTRIAKVSFSLTSRQAAMALASRGMTFTLN